MKKLLMILTITGLISFLFGNYIFNVYKVNMEEVIKKTSSTYEPIYMLLYGSYKNKDDAVNNGCDNYILIESGGYYKVYIGITRDIKIANKIEEIYKEFGNDIYIKENGVNSLEFIDYLIREESDLLNKSDKEILSIENNIINKYKELILNE